MPRIARALPAMAVLLAACWNPCRLAAFLVRRR
jgi:hypothetical protein